MPCFTVTLLCRAILPYDHHTHIARTERDKRSVLSNCTVFCPVFQDLSPFVHQDHVSRLQKKPGRQQLPSSLPPAPNPEAIRKASNPIALRYWSQCVQAAAAVSDPVASPTATPITPPPTTGQYTVPSPAPTVIIPPGTLSYMSLQSSSPGAGLPVHDSHIQQRYVTNGLSPVYSAPVISRQPGSPTFRPSSPATVARQQVAHLPGGRGPAEVLPPWHQPDYCAAPSFERPAAGRPHISRVARVTVRTESPRSPPTGLAAWARCRSVPRDYAQATILPSSNYTGRPVDQRRSQDPQRWAAGTAEPPAGRMRPAGNVASPLPSRRVLDVYSSPPASEYLPSSPPPGARQRSRTPWAEGPPEQASSPHAFAMQRKVLA